MPLTYCLWTLPCSSRGIAKGRTDAHRVCQGLRASTDGRVGGGLACCIGAAPSPPNINTDREYQQEIPIGINSKDNIIDMYIYINK